MRSSPSPALAADRPPDRLDRLSDRLLGVGWTEPGGAAVWCSDAAAPGWSATAQPAAHRLGLADILTARDRLAAVAAGEAALLMTSHLSAAVASPLDAADLLVRLDQASMVMEYAIGLPVVRCEVVPRWSGRPAALLLDAAAEAGPIDRLALAESLAGELSVSSLRRLLSAVKFMLVFGAGRGRSSLLLGGSPCRVTSGYDPSAHVLMLGRVDRVQPVAAVNPVGADVGPEVPVPAVLAGCAVLDPGRQPGRLVLRLRGDYPERTLDRVAPALRRAGHHAVWLAGAPLPSPGLAGLEASAAAWPNDPTARHRRLVEHLLPLLDAAG